MRSPSGMGVASGIVVRRGTMLRLTRDQRGLLAEKLCDMANLAAGALVFGQLLSDQFSIALAIAGIFTWLSLTGWALALWRKRKP